MIDFVEKYFKFILALVITLVLILAGVSWLGEHDARLLAEAAVKDSESRISTLQDQAASIQKAGAARVKVLQDQRAEVKTTADAVREIPNVSGIPLTVRMLPDAPSSVQVEAVPLYQALNKCKQDSVSLDTCEQKAAISLQIIAEKDTEIQALKHPKGFWKRFGTTLKDVGIGVAIGYGVNAATRR